MKKIMTLSQFADLINKADEWEDEFSSIIEENGWVDETEKPWGICSDGNNRLELNEKGEAVVLSMTTTLLDLYGALISSATTERELNAILALVNNEYGDEVHKDDEDEDWRNHCHVTVRHLHRLISRRRTHLQNNFLRIHERQLAGYIRKQNKDFGWYLDASQKSLDLFHFINEKGGVK